MDQKILHRLLRDRLAELDFQSVNKLLFKKMDRNPGFEHYINFEVQGARVKKLSCEFGVRHTKSYDFGLNCIKNFGDRDGLYSEFYSSNLLPYNIRNSLLLFLFGEYAAPIMLSENTFDEIEINMLKKIETQLLPLLTDINDVESFCGIFGKNSLLYPFSRSNTAFRLAEYIFLYRDIYGTHPDIEPEDWRKLVSANLRNGVEYADYLDNVFEQAEHVFSSGS